MQIKIRDINNLSELDIKVLQAVTGGESVKPSSAEKPASKAVSAPKAEPKAEPKKAAKAPVEEPEEYTEDDTEESSGATMKDAIAIATKLVSDGKTALVKETLAGFGAKRVSDLSGANIDKFVSALS